MHMVLSNQTKQKNPKVAENALYCQLCIYGYYTRFKLQNYLYE